MRDATRIRAVDDGAYRDQPGAIAPVDAVRRGLVRNRGDVLEGGPGSDGQVAQAIDRHESRIQPQAHGGTAAAEVAERHGREGLRDQLGHQSRTEAVRRRLLGVDVDRELRLGRGQVGLDVTQLGVLLELGHDQVRRLAEGLRILPTGTGFEPVGSGTERGGLDLSVANAVERVQFLL